MTAGIAVGGSPSKPDTSLQIRENAITRQLLVAPLRGTALDKSAPGEDMTIKEATNGNKSTVHPRARRYDIVTTLRYRVRGESTWQEGLLKNFSISGILITAKQPLDVGTNVEMRFTLPIELKGSSAADVFCRGHVVRSKKELSADSFVTIAARLSYSHLLRQSSQE